MEKLDNNEIKKHVETNYKNIRFEEIKFGKGGCSSFKEVVEKKNEIFTAQKGLGGKISVAELIFAYIQVLDHANEIEVVNPEDLYSVEELIATAVKYYHKEFAPKHLSHRNRENTIPFAAFEALSTLPILVSSWIKKGNLKEAERITNLELYVKELERTGDSLSPYRDAICLLAKAHQLKYDETKDEKFLKKSKESVERYRRAEAFNSAKLMLTSEYLKSLELPQFPINTIKNQVTEEQQVTNLNTLSEEELHNIMNLVNQANASSNDEEIFENDKEFEIQNEVEVIDEVEMIEESNHDVDIDTDDASSMAEVDY
jgi:hypothetical protein